MGQTHFSGPVIAGTKTTGQTDGPNQGYVRLSQTVAISFNATLVSNSTIYLPQGAIIESFTNDVLTAFDSATSATLSAGVASGGTEYMSGVNVKAATGRIAATYTAAQLAASKNISVLGVAVSAANQVKTVNITVTSVGQPTAGYVYVTVNYIQI